MITTEVRDTGAVSNLSWGPHAGPALPVAVEVLRRGPISRADIARRLGLSHASLSRLSAPLVEQGLIFDTGERSDGRVGRPGKLLDVDPSSHHFLGVKLRESEIVAALTDLRGESLESIVVPVGDRSAEAVVEQIQGLCESLAALRAVTAIGIGIGGRVEGRRHVRHADFLGWDDVPLADLVEAATLVPTLVENDVVALCEYEDWFGFARHDDRFAVVTLGVGTGFGLVVNGEPVISDDYGIGLVGHWPMDPSGPLCSKGHRGCEAALLRSDAIARHASEAHGRSVSFDEALVLAENGDPAAQRITQDAARGLGGLLAAICNLTLPERIVIAGEGVRLAVIERPTLLQSLSQARDPRAHTPPIDFATGDNLEWARGAAVLAIKAFVLGSINVT